MDFLFFLAPVIGLSFLFLLFAFAWRRVVPTNEVHIVQTRKETISYGKGTGHGNTYYEIPSWIPRLGVSKIILPMSVFDLDLSGYEAYDKGRLPFVVDVKAFFRISESNVAAQRVSSFKELGDQLEAIVQGAVRTILAASDIEEIMQGRSKFGDEFNLHDQFLVKLKGAVRFTCPSSNS
jgi:flotillin